MPNTIKAAVGIRMDGNACAGWEYPSAPARPGEVSRGYFIEPELMTPLDGNLASSGMEFFEDILNSPHPVVYEKNYSCTCTPKLCWWYAGCFRIIKYSLLLNYKLVIVLVLNLKLF